MHPYTVLMHPHAFAELERYRDQLVRKTATPGARLRTQLGEGVPASLDTTTLLAALMGSKDPQIFAESSVSGDGSDWTATELSLLGDIGIAVGVKVFDNGRHHRPTEHPEPFDAHLLFIPGALLRNGRGQVPADWAAVTTPDGKVDAAGYNALYERRLLPLFHFANRAAAQSGKRALITVPGLGCGQFAGVFRGSLGAYLEGALVALLKQHAPALPNVAAVYYDPYSECANTRHNFSHLSLLVRPLAQGNESKPQLCPPTQYEERGDDFSDCILFSVVAWDHVSWPGNDFYGGARVTDDGVKAAATDSMRAMTGVEGHYDLRTFCYEPPEPHRTWSDVLKACGARLDVAGRLEVMPRS